MKAVDKIAKIFELELSDYDKRVMADIIREERTYHKRVVVYKDSPIRGDKPTTNIDQYFAKWQQENGPVKFNSRKREVVRQRVNFSRQAYKDGYTYEEIAKVLRLRNHTSILHYVRKCKL